MGSSLRDKALSGIIWKFIETSLNVFLGFFISVVLARLLTPGDYGLIGMITVFISLSSVIIDSGFGHALIQDCDRTDEDFDTVFIVNLSLACICYLSLFFSAPYIALFFGVPVLVDILRVVGIVIILNSIKSIQFIQLQISLDFKTSSKVTFAGIVSGGVVGIILAYNGFGVWSLVFQSLVNVFISTLVLWFLSKWRPHFRFSFLSFHRLFKFGSKILISGVYNVLLNNIYNVLIGRIYKGRELGLFTKSNEIPSLAAETLNTIINSVSFPLLSSINRDPERMINVFKKLFSLTTFIVCPFMVLLGVFSRPFVLLVFTSKWIEIVPLMQLFCFARMITPLNTLNLNILKAYGRSDWFLWTDAAKIPFVVISLIITIPFGIKSIAVGALCVSLICLFINSYLPGRKLGYGIIAQFKDCYRIYLSIILMTMIVYPLKFAVESDMLLLVLGLVFGILSYLFFSWILKVKEFFEIKNLVVSFLRK